MSTELVKIYAKWEIQLHVTCPKCQERFDMMDDDDFRCDASLEPLESDTNATRDVDVICPDCEHEFTVDFYY
ncbi:Uncharacterised protein [Yersinia nurmii]|uniref:Uncharacterized protein n=1 Tax=Yersinia nurmii TaxID=685706 RepID=A0ABM9SNQ1_9GAMM|nr:Uncharacterised protein [Yersinia nurmii]